MYFNTVSGRQDRLKEQMPTYGQGDKLQTAFDTYLSTLNKQGLPRDPNELRPGIKTSQAINRFNEARQPFIRPNPQVDEGGFFDLDMFNRNVSESRALEQKLAEEDLKRQEQRKWLRLLSIYALGSRANWYEVRFRANDA